MTWNFIGQHQSAPVLGYHRQRRPFHGNFTLALSAAQEGQCLEYWVRGYRAAELDGLKQQREEAPHLTVMIDQLVKIAGFILAAAEFVHRLHIFFF